MVLADGLVDAMRDVAGSASESSFVERDFGG